MKRPPQVVSYSETRESKEAMQVRSGRKESAQDKERAKLRQNLCWSRLSNEEEENVEALIIY